MFSRLLPENTLAEPSVEIARMSPSGSSSELFESRLTGIICVFVTRVPRLKTL